MEYSAYASRWRCDAYFVTRSWPCGFVSKKPPVKKFSKGPSDRHCWRGLGAVVSLRSSVTVSVILVLSNLEFLFLFFSALEQFRLKHLNKT